MPTTGARGEVEVRAERADVDTIGRVVANRDYSHLSALADAALDFARRDLAEGGLSRKVTATMPAALLMTVEFTRAGRCLRCCANKTHD